MYRSASGIRRILNFTPTIDLGVYRDEGEENENENDGSSDDGSGEGASGTGTGDGENNDTIKDPEKKRLSDEAAKYRTERNEFKSKTEELQRKLKEFEDKDKSELEKVQSELADAIARAEKAEALAQRQGYKLAFLEGGNAAKFKNATRAMQLLEGDLKTLKPDDDGNYDQAEITKLAESLLKSDPYLAADGSEGPGSTPPGGSPNNGRRSRGGEADRKALEKKFPALRRN